MTPRSAAISRQIYTQQKTLKKKASRTSAVNINVMYLHKIV